MARYPPWSPLCVFLLKKTRCRDEEPGFSHLSNRDPRLPRSQHRQPHIEEVSYESGELETRDVRAKQVGGCEPCQ
jgi:hypothetical protein